MIPLDGSSSNCKRDHHVIRVPDIFLCLASYLNSFLDSYCLYLLLSWINLNIDFSRLKLNIRGEWVRTIELSIFAFTSPDVYLDVAQNLDAISEVTKVTGIRHQLCHNCHAVRYLSSKKSSRNFCNPSSLSIHQTYDKTSTSPTVFIIYLSWLSFILFLNFFEVVAHNGDPQPISWQITPLSCARIFIIIHSLP